MGNGYEAQSVGAKPYVSFHPYLCSPAADVWETSHRWGAWIMFTWNRYYYTGLSFTFHSEGHFSISGETPTAESLEMFHNFLWGAVGLTRRALKISP
jgi:hypothetical protein